MNARNDADHPVVYLDIDGVVTTEGYQRQVGKDQLNPAQVGRVAALVRDFGARVVVSSTWRVEDCRATLVEAGLPADGFHPDWRTRIPEESRDPETGAMLPAELAHRGDEISEHIRRNRVSRYLVLDDVDVGPAHAARHVRPAVEIGLTEADAGRARAILASDLRKAPIPARALRAHGA